MLENGTRVRFPYGLPGLAANGCLGSAVITQSVITCTGMDEWNKTGSLQIYPNPNNGTFYIAGNTKNKTMEILITDLSGRMLYKKDHNTSDVKLVLDEYANGIYLVKIKCGDELLNHKVIIDR